MSKKTLTLDKTIAYILAAGGFVGFVAAFTLAVEKIKLIQDPSFVPSCNLSPLLSCGSVMNTPQASAFGFPNPLIGIAGFAIVMTIGFALLSGAKFKRWFWLGLQGGVVFGLGFISWLIFQSVYRIGALCPYCMVVWSVMIPIFWYTTLYNIRSNNIKVRGKLRILTDFFQRNHGNILIALYALVIALILNHFWYYWSTLL